MQIQIQIQQRDTDAYVLGSQTVDLGPRTSDRGSQPRAADRGPRTSDRGPRTSDLGPWTAVLGPRTAGRGPGTSDRCQHCVPESFAVQSSSIGLALKTPGKQWLGTLAGHRHCPVLRFLITLRRLRACVRLHASAKPFWPTCCCFQYMLVHPIPPRPMDSVHALRDVLEFGETPWHVRHWTRFVRKLLGFRQRVRRSLPRRVQERKYRLYQAWGRMFCRLRLHHRRVLHLLDRAPSPGGNV